MGDDIGNWAGIIERLGVAVAGLIFLFFCAWRVGRYLGIRLFDEDKGLVTLYVGKQMETLDKVIVTIDTLTTNSKGHAKQTHRRLKVIGEDVNEVKTGVRTILDHHCPRKPKQEGNA